VGAILFAIKDAVAVRVREPKTTVGLTLLRIVVEALGVTIKSPTAIVCGIQTEPFFLNGSYKGAASARVVPVTVPV
jgi:hypothetical protein